MRIYIVGEDDVSKEIIKRILSYCGDFDIVMEFPVRGGQIKNPEIIYKFNIMSLSNPVILLTDLDNNYCPPQFLHQCIENKNDTFIFNIAVDEGEAWLMADREGFANYFRISLDNMPSSYMTRQNGNKELREMNFNCKSSLYLTHTLINHIGNSEYKKQLTPREGASKGPEYNSCICNFIRNNWDINNARKNTDSLDRMIKRIERLKIDRL